MKRYIYFYRTENLINGNFYYGVHKTSILEDGYLGSGKRILYAIKKYGNENFKKEILLFFDTYDEALNYESEIVTEKLIMDPSCYNLALGGKSDTGFLRKGPALINKDTKELIKPNTIEEFNKLFKSGNYFGHTKNHANFKNENGKIFYLDINDKKIKELNLHGITSGRFISKDKNGNTYMINKNDERYLNGELVGIWKNKKHSTETKQKIKKTMNEHNHQKGEKNSQYGTILIHNINLKKCTRIKKENLNEWLKQGWLKGGKFNWKK